MNLKDTNITTTTIITTTTTINTEAKPQDKPQDKPHDKPHDKGDDGTRDEDDAASETRDEDVKLVTDAVYYHEAGIRGQEEALIMAREMKEVSKMS